LHGKHSSIGSGVLFISTGKMSGIYELKLVECRIHLTSDGDAKGVVGGL